MSNVLKFVEVEPDKSEKSSYAARDEDGGAYAISENLKGSFAFFELDGNGNVDDDVGVNDGLNTLQELVDLVEKEKGYRCQVIKVGHQIKYSNSDMKVFKTTLGELSCVTTIHKLPNKGFRVIKRTRKPDETKIEDNKFTEVKKLNDLYDFVKRVVEHSLRSHYE